MAYWLYIRVLQQSLHHMIQSMKRIGEPYWKLAIKLDVPL
jgi:hypothetical protein